MNTKELFLKTLEDLEKKSQSQDWYDMLLISGLIYKLLYDKHPMVYEVNTSKIPISFEVNDMKLHTDPSLMFSSVEDAFDPQTTPPPFAKPMIVNTQVLYSREVMTIGPEILTVKDLIKFLRNKQGGVHYDNVASVDKEPVLKELQETMGIAGVTAGLRLMRAISRVVVRGLQPLKQNLQ